MHFTTNYLELKLVTSCAVAYLEHHDTDDIVNEEDESNGTNATTSINRPTHARKATGDGNGL